MASIPADVTSTLSARIPRSQSMPRPHTPPHLLAWDTTVLSSSSSPLTSPSLSPVLSPASQIFAEDYYAPHAKSLWQLAQSEPVISPDYGDDRGLAKTVDVPGTSPQKDKTPRMRDTAGTHANLKRRNTLHVNIPTKYIGHTRSVSDEDPVLALEDEKGDSDAEPGFEQSSRGRSRIRRRSDVRLGGSLPPPDDLLRSPPYIVCQATTDTACPHGASCPYSHTHVPSPLLRRRHPSRTREILALAKEVNAVSQSLISRIPHSKRPSSATTTAVATLSDAGNNKSPPPPTTTTTVSSSLPKGTHVPVQGPLDALGLPPHPLVRAMDLSQYPRSSRSRAASIASEDSKVLGGVQGRHSRRGSSNGGKFAVVGIPPFKASRRGSDASAAAAPEPMGKEAPPTAGTTLAKEETETALKSAKEEEKDSPNKTMDRDSSSQPKQPPMRVVKRPATVLEDLLSAAPVVPAIQPEPTSVPASIKPKKSILPPADIYDADGNRIIGGHPTGEKILLHDPSVRPEDLDNPPRSTRSGRMVRPGGLFGGAVASLASERRKDKKGKQMNSKGQDEGEEAKEVEDSNTAAASSAPTSATNMPVVVGPLAGSEKEKRATEKPTKMGNTGGMFTNNQGMFSKPMFSLPMSTAGSLFPQSNKPQPSRPPRSSNQPATFVPLTTSDPVSPSATSRTVDSDSTSRTHSTVFNQPSFTNPSRPLFSGYEHVVPTDSDGLPISENHRRGAEEWLQRQREKDLRQALRLEKALDEKRSGLIRRLEWKAPVVETQRGYGYGDGLEVQKETKLATGEVFKVLTWEERLEMEKEVKVVEDSLVKVREAIVRNGGEPGQAISYVGTALAEMRAKAKAVDERNARERAAATGEQLWPSPAIEESQEDVGSKEQDEDLGASGQSSSEIDTSRPEPQEQQVPEVPDAKDNGKGAVAIAGLSSFPTPQTPEHIVKAEQERALFISRARAGEKVSIERDRKNDIIAARLANRSAAGLDRSAQKPAQPLGSPEPPVFDPNTPEETKMPPSPPQTSPAAREDKPSILVQGKVAKRPAFTLDDGMFGVNSKETKIEAKPRSSGNGFLDLLASAAILGGHPAKLTEESMKQHDQMMAEEENRRAKGTPRFHEHLVNSLLPPKAEAAKTMSPPSPSPPREKSAFQKSGRSMWARWGDSPLPGTPGAPDGPGSPPFLFMKPRPASSVPPPEAIARPSSVAPAAAQLMSPAEIQAAKHERRVSMSTAKPGEEASSQTAQGLNFDDSDEDENGDDSRDYVSAEEGEDVNLEDGKDAPEPQDVPRSRESDGGHYLPSLQRKRSSTTVDVPLVAPVPENRHRPSPLDDWNFDFTSRKAQRNLASPGPFSSAASTSGASIFGGRSTPTRYQRHSRVHHRRKSSQESSQFTPLFGYGVAAPNNTPDSPPPRRYDPVSPTMGRTLNSERYTVTRPESSPGTLSQFSEGPDRMDTPNRIQEAARAQLERPYFVVTRSANVLDEAANLIEYSTARVMSGGVKIGSILPHGVDGVIEEADEERAELEVDFETTAPIVPLAAPGMSSTTSPPLLGPQMAVTGYPLGVPVPGHPQAVSAAPLIPMSAVMAPPAQPAVMAVAPAPTAPASHLPVLSSGTHLQNRPSLALSPHGLQHTPHLSLPSPVTSTSGSQSQATPVEYCGDFRTTGHCRFGTRCRYSHDIEPRVRTSTSTAGCRYRPTPSSPAADPPSSPRTVAVGIPPVPPGYQLSNVLPQPHHIPGVPLSKQPLSPFVFAHHSTVAHPLTSPAATAAAHKGMKMRNTEKANKILKSLGLTPQQLLAHQPAPTVMADGEIMYDLTQGRPKEGTLLGQDPLAPYPTGFPLSRGVKGAHDMLLMHHGMEQEKRSAMQSSASMVPDNEDDVRTATRRRRSQLPGEAGSSQDGRRRGSRPTENEQTALSQADAHRQSPQQYQHVEVDTRRPSQTRTPASYSPVQHLPYPITKQHLTSSHPSFPQHYSSATQYQHPIPIAASLASVTPANTPSPAPAPVASAPGGSLTQEEVIKVLTALGLSVPGLTTTSAHPTPSTAPTALYSTGSTVPSTSSHIQPKPQRSKYPPRTYEHMHPSMHH